MGLISVLKESTVIHLMFAITFFTSGLIINFFQFCLYFGLRPFSRYYYRKINYYLLYSLNSQLVFMIEWWCGSDIVLYTDKEVFNKYASKEHTFIIMNHSFEIDWLFGWIICERLGVLGNCKAYSKKEVQYLPSLGWAWKFGESVFLARNWQKDQQTISNQIKEIANYPDSVWLLLCPEGTRCTPKKLEASQAYAREKGLPVLQHHLTPRTKGFTASIPNLRGKFPAIYNVQIGVNPDDPEKPSTTNLLLGKRAIGYFYIERIPLEEVPEDDEGAAEWLHKLFQKKDRLAKSFSETGDFFATSDVPRVGTVTLKRRYYTCINTACWIVIVLVPMLYYLVNLFLSGSFVYFSIGVTIILVFYVLLQKMIGMSQISKASTYGTNDKKVK